MAADWWNPDGKFKPLHKFNPVRLGFIRDQVCTALGREAKAARPFEGLRLLDIGCGGGLLCEPMTRLGAAVTGVDATEANIKTAMTHAAQSGLAIDYRVGTAEGLIEAGEPAFDVVLNMEVVEHVADPAVFMQNCARLVAPGGVMIVATLNRTAKAFALAIVGAEYVLGWLPRGTHEWSKFVTPAEIRTALAADSGLTVAGPIGVSFNPVLDRWSLGTDAAVNYLMTARRAA
jgi:2-polyprenyl-6-hydroxyphenyl methylase/3-demethylubiquinone-9 3-methyltransferase